MRPFLGYLALGLLSLQAAFAAEEAILQAVRQGGELPNASSSLQIEVSTSFPDAEIFGVKLINGIATEAHISIANHEPEKIQVRYIGGSIWATGLDGDTSQPVRNLTTTVYDGFIPSGERDSFIYRFTTDMHPRDVRLKIVALVTSEKSGTNMMHQVLAYNETVSVVEAPTNFFDPQILFLYLILAASFAGASYYVYNTWIVTLFPQQKKRPAPRSRGSHTPKTPKGTDASTQVSVAGSDGVTTGAKAYDESWIPAHHIQRPEAKRVRSGTPTGTKTKRTA